MPDAPDPQIPPVAPQPTTPAPTPIPSAEEPLGDAGKKALDEERRARKEAEKARKELEDRLKAIEDKDKTELERAQQRLAELEKNYATEQQQRLRLQVASAHGVTADDLVLLTGTTEEELVAQATRIAALNANRAAATAAPTFVPSPAQHAGNATPPNAAMTAEEGERRYREWQARTKL